jgi:isoleucyl-tRNA synthetase
MSKSYGNYPDPKAAMNQYGGDTMRMFLCTSPIVIGGDANFSEDGLKETYKKMTLPLWNSYYFYTTYAGIDQFTSTLSSIRDIDIASLANPLDRWMVMQTMEMVNIVDNSLQ